MQSRDNEFTLDPIENIATGSVFAVVSELFEPSPPPVEGFFLLLDGSNFLLLDGEDLTLL